MLDSRLCTSVTLLQLLRQGGRPEAWTRFVKLYAPLLLFWARKLELQDSDAADLVQDVLTAVVTRMPSFEYDREQSFRRWLRTILLNRWRDRQRRRAAVGMLTGASGILTAARSDQPDEVAEFLDADEAEYRQRLVSRAMQLIEPEFQPATWRAFWEHGAHGRPADDVARELGVTVGAVYAAKFRVLARLRQELQGFVE